MRALARALRRFALREEAGSVSVEAVVIMPLLLWWYVASFVFFDGFKQHSMNVKAAYTVGDMLSRQTDAINDAYLEGMSDIFDYLTQQRNDSWLRVTQIYWQGSRDRYRIDWSYGTDGHNDARLTNGDLDDIAERLPTLVNGERIILVESFTTYAPAFNVGLEAELLFSNFVVTSPRYAPQLAKN